MDTAAILRGCLKILDDVSENQCDARLLVVIAALERIIDEVDEMVERTS